MLCSSAVTVSTLGPRLPPRQRAASGPRVSDPRNLASVQPAFLRAPSGGPTAAGSTSGRSRLRRYVAPVDPPVPGLARRSSARPSPRAARARPAASSSCWSSASASPQTSAYDERSWATVAQRRGDRLVGGRVEPGLGRARARTPSHRLGSSSRRASRCSLVVGQAAEPVDVRPRPWPRRGTPARGTAPTGSRSPARAAGGTRGSPAASSSRARRPAGPARARSRASG